jgi:hypothetical protein
MSVASAATSVKEMIRLLVVVMADRLWQATSLAAFALILPRSPGEFIIWRR